MKELDALIAEMKSALAAVADEVNRRFPVGSYCRYRKGRGTSLGHITGAAVAWSDPQRVVVHNLRTKRYHGVHVRADRLEIVKEAEL